MLEANAVTTMCCYFLITKKVIKPDFIFLFQTRQNDLQKHTTKN
jgi:hypothetical protein